MGDIMFSLHMKATMMKVSDPIIFGHCVKEFYKDVFEKHGATFEKLGVNVNNGLGDVYTKIASLPEAEKKAIEDDIEKQYETRPRIAMVNAGKKITNLHVPSDVIIDNSVPTAIRWGGQMQGPSGKDEDIKAVIPDRSYATTFKDVIDYRVEKGGFDPKTKDAPIKDWVKLAVTRTKAYSPCKAIFWLDAERAHDKVLIEKVEKYLKDHDTTGLDIEIMPPLKAMRTSCE